MKKFTLAFALLCAIPAFGWNCSDPLASRVPVAAGTAGSYGNGDGQLFMGTGSEGTKGQLYQCQVPKTPTPTPPPTVAPSQTQSQNQSNSQGQSQTSNVNAALSSTNSNSNTNVNKSKSTSNSNASSLSSSSSNSSSNSAVNNSGNSSATATGGTASNNSSGNTTSFSSVNNEVRQTPFAYAPDAAFTTSPCVKGFSGGASFPGGAGSFGFSKTDKGCDSRQTAMNFHAIGNDYASAKILCSTDASKRAHLTMDDCLKIVTPAQPQIIVPTPAPVAATAPPLVIVVPTPVAAEAPVPVAVERKSKIILHTVGTCKLPYGRPTNVCYRVLDDALLALEQNPDSKIVLTGPVESGKLVPYLQKRVSPSRIEIKLADEQDWTLNVQTEIVGE